MYVEPRDSWFFFETTWKELSRYSCSCLLERACCIFYLCRQIAILVVGGDGMRGLFIVRSSTTGGGRHRLQSKHPCLEVIKLEYSLRLKIKRNDWLFADTCPQAANHCALFLVLE